jgi:TonB family protein
VNWKCCALVFALLACPSVVHGEPADSSLSPEAQRFEAAKLTRQRGLAYNYVRTAKSTIDKAWQESHPPASGKLLITKVKITLDARGKMSDYKVLAGSGSEQEDKSVHDCLSGTTFKPLPIGLTSIGLTSLHLFWTLMSDGTMNMVENTDPDANMQPNGSVIRRPNISAQADVDFGPYMSDLQKRIKSAWLPPKGCESKRVIVVFKVHRDGALSNQRISHSSGVAVADQAALKALESAAPFRPLPAGASENMDIQFTFDCNVFNGGVHGTFRAF